MIVDQKQVAFFKGIAVNLFVTTIINDYGADKRQSLIFLTDGISEIYKHLRYTSFEKVTILVNVGNAVNFTPTQGIQSRTIRTYESLSQVNGKKIVIEIKSNRDLECWVDIDVDINTIRNDAIVYQYSHNDNKETFFGKSSDNSLDPIPDGDSWFAVHTYKDLEVALEDYGTKVARHSDCLYLESAWSDPNRIFFKPKPEHTLRDSLTHFLKIRLRNTEGRPEQVVDKSHPVDIKVTWAVANHLALIEIKWLGKSLAKTGKKITSSPNNRDAIDGAQQLADYLDANKVQAPTKTTKGYLVVYDGRRAKCKVGTKTVSKDNGFKYENMDVPYRPEFHKTRDDFAKPIRFFLEPKTV